MKTHPKSQTIEPTQSFSTKTAELVNILHHIIKIIKRNERSCWKACLKLLLAENTSVFKSLKMKCKLVEPLQFTDGEKKEFSVPFSPEVTVTKYQGRYTSRSMRLYIICRRIYAEE